MVNKIDLLSDGEFKELIENSSSVSDVLKSLGYAEGITIFENTNKWYA